MQLKKIAQLMLVTGVLALSACSSMHHGSSGTDGSGGTGTNDEADASGLGTGENFDGSSNQQMAQKRTYYFEFDRSDVQEGDKPAILANADYLIAHPDTKIILEGHTDPRGSREYNVALGERRADAVLEMLRSRGVNPVQVRVVSYGAERLASVGHSESDYQQDRRAIIVIEQG